MLYKEVSSQSRCISKQGSESSLLLVPCIEVSLLQMHSVTSACHTVGSDPCAPLRSGGWRG